MIWHIPILRTTHINKFFVVAIDDYVYLIPYVESETDIFLKTIIPSRKATKLYLGTKS